MHTEIEIKVKIAHGEKLMSFLQEHGTFKFENQQVDEYYSKSGTSEDFLLVDPIKKWLRLRSEQSNSENNLSGETYSINYKNWIYNETGTSNHCEEFESKVESLESVRKILEALGYTNIVTVDKLRKVYDYNDYEISIDSVKNLGDYVEIEYKGKPDLETGEITTSESERITNEMMKFLSELVGEILERDKRGYPYGLLKQDGKI